MTTTTERAYHLRLTKATHPVEMAALKMIPVWLHERFQLTTKYKRGQVGITATGMGFWNLAGIVGQLENIAVNDEQHDAASALYRLRVTLGEAANCAVEG